MSEHSAWIFPGQGSQRIGMGREAADRSAEAQQVFAEADSTLDIEVSTLCWHGPDDDLTLTRNQQPAILAASIAMFRALHDEGCLPQPEFIAGHSLGEYSALVAGGSLDLPDALRLVRRRGELMEQHGLGGMIVVIGLDDEAAQVIANETGVEVANFNSPGQITLSGTDDALAVAEMSASTRGAKRVLKLPVNGAFHSSLMEPVAQELATDIAATTFREPIAPLVTNTDALPIRHPDDIRRELVDHITRSVQWTRVMEFMIGSGVTNFYEIGPGNVLSGLARRIDRSVTVKTADQVLAVAGGDA